MRSTIRQSTALWVPVLAALLILPAQALFAGQHGPHGYYAYGHDYWGDYDFRFFDTQTSERDGSRQLALADLRGLGGLDLDVKPEKTKVSVNGDYVGLSHDFDGTPSYLWLKEGIYEVMFSKPGQETIVREVAVFRGMVFKVNERLHPAESPEERVGGAQ